MAGVCRAGVPRRCGTASRTARLAEWCDARRSGAVRQLHGHTGAIRAMAWSPDGSRLATIAQDGSLRFWDPTTPGTRREVSRKAPLRIGFAQLVFDATGDVLWVHGANGLELTWDLAANTTLSLAASPIDDTLVMGCADQSVRLWSPTRGELGTLRGHTGDVHAVAFSHDGLRLASGSRDGTVRIWDVANLAEVASLRSGGAVIAVAFSPDGTRLASFGSMGTTVVWDARGAAKRRANH